MYKVEEWTHETWRERWQGGGVEGEGIRDQPRGGGVGGGELNVFWGFFRGGVLVFGGCVGVCVYVCD